MTAWSSLSGPRLLAAVAEPPLRVVPFSAGRLVGLAVSGELDLATVPLLDAGVADVFDSRPGGDPVAAGGFLLGLEDLTFLDGSGVWALARIHDRSADRGLELYVAAPAEASPRRLLLLAVARGWLAPVFAPDRLLRGEGG